MLNFICLMGCSLFCSQHTPVTKKIDILNNARISDAEKTRQTGLIMLKIARTSKDFSKAYSKIADGLYKKEQFSEALKYYNKVDSISTLLNDWEEKFMSNFFMTGIYQKVGLSVQAEEGLKKINQLSKKIDKSFPTYMIKQQKATFLEESELYSEAIPVRRDILILDERRLNKDNLEINDRFLLINSYNRLGYNYLKCNMPEKAGYYIRKADEIFKTVENCESPVTPTYYMVKGLSAAKLNDKEKAVLWFNKALEQARKDNSTILVTKILEERLRNDIDDSHMCSKLFLELTLLKQRNKKESVKVISIYEQNSNKIIAAKNDQLLLLLVVLAITFGIFFYYKRKKQQKILQFENIIQRFTDMNHPESEFNTASCYIQTTEHLDSLINEEVSPGKVMSEEKEQELLNKIFDFEKRTDYLENNFSIANMATLLETNSRYINYILQKYREKSFSHYINHLRIKYCVCLLQENPEYLNYKISHLSDTCGYSSHSRFAYIFKKETGISPSRFIAHLSKRKTSEYPD